MFGPSGIHNDRKTPKDMESMGIIPRAVSEIFECIENKNLLHCTICCSFVQIYNENLYDMLR